MTVEKSAYLYQRKGSNMAQYRKKPVIIDAFKYQYQFAPDITQEYPQWAIDAVLNGTIVETDVQDYVPYATGAIGGTGTHYLSIVTLEGTMKADEGDWVIKGVKGEIYPCKPDIFEMTYEKVED